MTHHTWTSLSLIFENFFKTTVATLLNFVKRRVVLSLEKKLSRSVKLKKILMRSSVVNGLEAKTKTCSKTGPDE